MKSLHFSLSVAFFLSVFLGFGCEPNSEEEFLNTSTTLFSLGVYAAGESDLPNAHGRMNLLIYVPGYGVPASPNSPHDLTTEVFGMNPPAEVADALHAQYEDQVEVLAMLVDSALPGGNENTVQLTDFLPRIDSSNNIAAIALVTNPNVGYGQTEYKSNRANDRNGLIESGKAFNSIEAVTNYFLTMEPGSEPGTYSGTITGSDCYWTEISQLGIKRYWQNQQYKLTFVFDGGDATATFDRINPDGTETPLLYAELDFNPLVKEAVSNEYVVRMVSDFMFVKYFKLLPTSEVSLEPW